MITRALIPIIIVIVALVTGTLHIRNRSQISANNKNIVPMPLVGGTEAANREGPWHECVGLSGEECKNLIESYADDVRGNVHVIPQDSMVTMDFRTDRVRIFVDDQGIVTRAPSRG